MKRGSAVRWERAPVRPILLQTSFHSAMEKGKFHKSSKDSSKRGRQTPVLYAMLDHSRSTKAASEKKSKGLGDSRKDKK